MDMESLLLITSAASKTGEMTSKQKDVIFVLK